MSINVSEVIWTVICFFVLLFVLKKLLFTPLITFMEDRKARVDAALAEKRAAEQQQQESNNALQDSWKARSDEAKQLVAEGGKSDDKDRAAVLQQAQEQAAQAQSDARGRIEQEAAAVQQQANEQMDELVTVLAQQLLQDESK